MAVLSLIALMPAMFGLSLLFSGDDDLTTDDEPEPEIEPLEEPSEEDGNLVDIGATFLETEDGVTLELGDDETGSLAVIYYTDTEDNAADWLEVDEARFYLVPEGVDWSEADWETRDDVPGAESDPYYELADFEAYFDLELLGVVNLKGVPAVSDDPESRIGEIEANAPVAGYYLEANTDGDDLVTFLPEDYVVTRGGAAETQVVENTVGSDEADWLSTDVAGLTLDGAGGDDVLVGSAANLTLNGGEGNDKIESDAWESVTIDAGDGDDSVTAFAADVNLGAGDDYAQIRQGYSDEGSSITVYGGDGADVVYANGRSEDTTVALFGEAGNDLLSVYGDSVDDVAFGGDGDDTVSAYSGSVANGGAGDDVVHVDTGSQALGGTGNDLITVYNGVSGDNGPATLTGGDGQDTIEASLSNFRGDAEGVFAIVTDFDPDEDVLILKGGGSGGADLQNVTLIHDEDGGFTDVDMEYTWTLNGNSGSAMIRLDGITDLTLAQIDIRT